MPELEFYQYAIAIIGGAFAGALNTLAGNGSAITLTILTEVLQLPPNMANGTNRVGIFTQSSAGAYAFYRHGKLDIKRSRSYFVYTIIGAIVGVIVATRVSNEQFKSVFSILMVAMLFVILVKPKRWLIQTDPNRKVHPLIIIPAFLALGFYGGFIQMGMGIFFLAVMVLLARFSIIEANAVKSFIIAIYTFIVILIFQSKGLINWQLGLLMAVGQTTGGWLTASYASRYPKADVWAYRLLVVVVIFAIVRLFGIVEWIQALL
ncbi:MAG: sulfite exporter TauE/SafE family protein [Bacteroidota bacterium]